jgi:glycosyltransferase involved in cell wall biosynthesis
MKIIVIGVLPSSLLNFRGELIRSIHDFDHEVVAIASGASKAEIEKIEVMGAEYIDAPIQRTGLNVFSDIKTFFKFRKLFKQLQPDIIMAYTIKPVIWGGLAARLSGVPFYGLVTGLGFAFQGSGFKRKLLTFMVTKLYASALKASKAVIFQNKDNRDVFIERNIVSSEKCHVVNGSGVNISSFQYKAIPDGEMTFLCVSRLLKEKGLREYAAASALVKKQYPYVKFLLVGPEDPSPDGIAIEEVRAWSSIEYMGETKDVRPFIRQCHVYVLPSYHEGLPRSTLEAMATGRPILTTDAVGCRETVDSGINGFKVAVSNITELAERMTWFIENLQKLNEMGKASRKMVEQKFDVNKVNDSILKIMELK